MVGPVRNPATRDRDLSRSTSAAQFGKGFNAAPGPQQPRQRRPTGTEVGLQIQRRHEPNGRISPSFLFERGSDRFDRRSPWPFAPSLGSATAFIEFILDGLAFLKVVEAGFFHRRMVEEDVSPLCGDESETTVRDDFLNYTLRHHCHPHITRRDKTRRNASPDLPAQTKRKPDARETAAATPELHTTSIR